MDQTHLLISHSEFYFSFFRIGFLFLEGENSLIKIFTSLSLSLLRRLVVRHESELLKDFLHLEN